MAFTNNQVLDLTLTALYQEGYSSATVWSDTAGVVTTIPAKGKDILVGWLDKIPSMREWIGNRVANNASLRTYPITIKKWESTEFLDRTVVDDNQLGLYAAVFKMMGVNMAKLKDRVTGLKIKSNPIGFDGVAFFSGSHPINLDDPSMGTYSNVVNAPTLAQAMTLAVEQAANFVGADGENIGFVPTHLLIASGKKVAAETLLHLQFIPNAAGTATTENVFRNSVDLILAPELNLTAAEQSALGAGKYYAYLLDLSHGISPFVYALRDAPEFQNLGIQGDFDPMTDQYRYGARARSEAAMSLPFLAIRMLIEPV